MLQEAALITGSAALITGALTIQHALVHLLTYLQHHTGKLGHYFPKDVPNAQQLLYNPLVRQQDLRADLLFSDKLAIDETAHKHIHLYRAGVALFGTGATALAILYLLT